MISFVFHDKPPRGPMRSQDQNFFVKSKWILDAVIIMASWWGSYYFRFKILPGDTGLDATFAGLTPIICAVSIYTFFKNRVYDTPALFSMQSEFLRVLKANFFAVLSFVIFLYFFAEGRVSRATLLLHFVVSTILLIFLRIGIRSLIRRRRKRGKGLQRLILVGESRQMNEYVKTLRTFAEGGFEILGWVDAKDTMGYRALPLMSLEEIKARYSPDSVVVGYADNEAAKTAELLKDHYNQLISIQVLPEMSYSLVGHQVEDFAGIPVLNLNTPNFSSIDLLLKRFFDITITGTGILFISPLLILLGVLVKISSSGPVFFTQERVGLNGKRFRMLKFRTMRVIEGAPEYGWTVENDPRRTPIGTFLRKTSLDELPQLFNVLRGDMSLVGPRPEMTFYVEKFKSEVPAYMLRHKMRCGITGWAQVNGWRGDTSIRNRIECDIYYIKNWSMWLDLKILFLTFWKGFINKNAY